MEFAELHAVSAYSFLWGASLPEELVRRAVELGMPALGVTDRDGFYGVVAFSQAARRAGLPTVIGAELGLAEGWLPVLARGPEGYRRLSRLISHARLAAGEKGAAWYPPLPEIARELGGHGVVLAGHRWAKRLPELVDCFGLDNVVLEYAHTMTAGDVASYELLDVAASPYPTIRGIATSTPGAATRHQADLAGLKRSLGPDPDPDHHPLGSTWLRSAAQMRLAFPDRPGLLATTTELAEECAFDFNLIAPRLPRLRADEAAWLRQLTTRRAGPRYAARPADVRRRAERQIAHELDVIEALEFPGYFLIVSDIVDFCREHNILCQGRGSAANSAVCFALGITNVEPVGAGLLFERFLSPERDGPPDIDLDIESGRREEVIQYVYRTYGRDNAAQVANVITYRRRGALRDVCRALEIDRPTEEATQLAAQLEGQPRHLGIHSGGMVICDRPIAEVVPVEWARKENRSVVQWDKDDCAAVGLVKFDLLGLGMLSALHHMIDLTEPEVRLWDLDLAEPAVYDMLARGDAVGVFQVESRAQLNTLPRLKPKEFFDLVVEVALIRPGPIQGGSVHPYLRRRAGEEPVTCVHPALAKTLGVPLFQEQIMQIALDAAGFSAGEADRLRKAAPELRERFLAGLAAHGGIVGAEADLLWRQIESFAAYGFPESHAQSFAALVYYSAWFKLHHPAQFYVGLLRAQPMGFYSPQSLLADARRHGIRVLPISVNDSGLRAAVPAPGVIRLGLDLVSGLGEAAGRRIEEAAARAPFTSIAELTHRADLTVAQAEALARAGALECLTPGRREALWEAGLAAGLSAPSLPGMTAFELMVADVSATGVTPTRQPMELLREHLTGLGITPAADLLAAADGTRLRVAGIVTHRQRPHTAGGVTFLGMEDETGLMNIVVSPGLWHRQRQLATTARALIVRGIVSNANGVAQVTADRLEPLAVAEALSRGSRDFR